ncbi:MAG: branched-chain amino acid ABC transporter permease [Anaerolineales bacterium]|jgi:branched-chain amino acid transport system permease protein|nr:branched-chain amino acid ABC transporter permease [Anaerolineales bacterium]
MFKKISREHVIFFGGALVVFLLIQLGISLGIVINDFWSTILRIGAVMAIVSLGLNLIYGFNGQFSLGQWGFYALGAYTAADITYRWYNDQSALGLTIVFLGVIMVGVAILYLRTVLSRIRGLDALSAFTVYFAATLILGIVAFYAGRALDAPVSSILMTLPDAVSMQIVFILAVLVAALFAAEVSFLFGLPVLMLGSDYFGIATLGFTIIVKVLLDNSDTMLGFEEMKGARGMIGIPKITSWFWVFLALILVVVIMRNLLHSSYGRAIIAVREDEIAAKAMGVDVAEYKILTFVIGSLFAGLAGGLYAHINGFLHPNTFNFIKSFDPMIIIVLGGLGSMTGTLAASFTWAILLEGVLRLVLPQGFELWRYVVYPLILLLIMLLRPKGIFGDYEMPYLRQLLPPLRKKEPEPVEQAQSKLSEAAQ